MSTTVIYTDGSCLPTNPGPGGWAYAIIDNNQADVVSGGSSWTTNNRMELTAALKALGTQESGSKVELYTDSEYVQKGISQYMPSWKEKDRLFGSRPVKNNDLWIRLDEENQRLDVTWHWVRAHNNNEWNEVVDKAAKAAVKNVVSGTS